MSRKNSAYKANVKKVRRGVRFLLFPGQSMFRGGGNALTSDDTQPSAEMQAGQKDWRLQ